MLSTRGGLLSTLGSEIARGFDSSRLVRDITDRSLLQPFFAGDAAGVSSRKRLLLLSYHFAPSRAVGALRWQALARHAAERGYALDVVTLDPTALDERDMERIQQLPPDTRLFGVSVPRLRVQQLVTAAVQARRSLLQKLRQSRLEQVPSDGRASTVRKRESFTWSEVGSFGMSIRQLDRMYSSWLDYASMGAWARQAADLALRLASNVSYEVVVSCGPPHMVHQAGRRVSAVTGIPLILDFRDPWSLVQRVPDAFASPLWLRYAKRYERDALSAASLVVVNTESHREALARAYPTLRAPLITVMNGYDDTDPLPSSRQRRRFIVAYAGTVYLDRDPRPLFRAAAKVIRSKSLKPSDFGLAFMGNATLDGQSLLELADAEGVGEFLELRPSGPRREALEFLAEASVLMSLPQDSDMAIPSKIFEYMRFHAWLLAFAAPGSATARVLEGTQADVIRPEDEEALVGVLSRHYDEHQRGERPPRIADDRRFSREAQACVLFDTLDPIIEARASFLESRISTPAAAKSGL